MRSGAGGSNDNQPEWRAHRKRWEYVGKLKNSYRHLGKIGGGAIAGANNNYYILVIKLYNNNNNHFRTERTNINR